MTAARRRPWHGGRGMLCFDETPEGVARRDLDPLRPAGSAPDKPERGGHGPTTDLPAPPVLGRRPAGRRTTADQRLEGPGPAPARVAGRRLRPLLSGRL